MNSNVLLDFPLPDDLRDFISITDCVVGMSVHNGYQIGGTALLTQLTGTGEHHCGGVAEPTIPIAFDGGGNWFVISASGRVWKCLHETRKAMPVADSFGAFLERIVADWSAYIANTPGWKFLV